MNFHEIAEDAHLYVMEINGKRYTQLFVFANGTWRQKEHWHRDEKKLRLEWKLCHLLILDDPMSLRSAVKKRYKKALGDFVGLSREFVTRWGFDLVPLTVRVNAKDAESLLESSTDNWINEENVRKVQNSCWRQLYPEELTKVYRHEFESDDDENASSWFGQMLKDHIDSMMDYRELRSVLDQAENDFDPEEEMNPVSILFFH